MDESESISSELDQSKDNPDNMDKVILKTHQFAEAI